MRATAVPPLVRHAGLALVAVLATVAAADRGTQSARPVVYVVPVEGVIDLGLAPYVERVLADAERARAAAVVLHVNTLGGRVDAAVLIRDALLRSPVPTVAFVDTRAISAGALIALAARTIAMAEGGMIGAATPVLGGVPGAAPQPVEEKTVSYMRSEFRATAEARNRPPGVAEAMVDADVAIEGITEKGKLLTLTTDEAVRHGIADVEMTSLAAVLAHLGLEGAEVREPMPTWAERLVRWLTHPVVASVLLMLGVLGLFLELQTPGLGLPGALGLACLLMFFGGHWLVRLAGWEELLLVLVGLVLLAVELFLIPGFGVAGVLGLGALVAGLTLSVVGAGATWPVVVGAAWRVGGTLVIAMALTVLAFGALPRLPLGRRLILQRDLAAGTGFASTPDSDRTWLGHRGTTDSALRPAGIALIDGARVDVVAEGRYVGAGEPVEVVKVDGNRVVVRPLAAGGDGGRHGT